MFTLQNTRLAQFQNDHLYTRVIAHLWRRTLNITSDITYKNGILQKVLLKVLLISISKLSHVKSFNKNIGLNISMRKT